MTTINHENNNLKKRVEKDSRLEYEIQQSYFACENEYNKIKRYWFKKWINDDTAVDRLCSYFKYNKKEAKEKVRDWIHVKQLWSSQKREEKSNGVIDRRSRKSRLRSIGIEI